MPKVLVCVADGSEDIEFSTSVDLLHRAGNEITIAKVGGDSKNNQCKLAQGLNVIADTHLNHVSNDEFDCIVTPGGMPGAATMGHDKTLVGMIKQHKEDGKLIAAICASPATVLGANGLLEGHEATCYPSKHFKEMVPKWVDHNVVVDKNIITSQGPGTAAEFSLSIIKHLNDKDTSKHVAETALFHSKAV